MKKIATLIFLALGLSFAAEPVMAQPKKSKVQTSRNGKKTDATPTVSRAELMFPTAVQMPEEVVWRRDLYRTIDLTKNENAALYNPIEPQGKRVNLFTLLFQLLNQGKIPAYQYKLDGHEDFSQENRMHFKDMLDRYTIPYEVAGNTLKVDKADIPSAEVLSYYIKESSYYDQNTATYHSRVSAICPVLHRADEFSIDPVKYPLFWVKYDDVATFLSAHTVMVSNLNNASEMSMADFFATNHYVGTIYMTNNMQGKTLQETCQTDSLLKKEQARIEKEMQDFEKHIWTTPVDSAEIARQDSIAKIETSKKKTLRATTTTTTTRSTASAATKKEKTTSSRRTAASEANKEKKTKSSSTSSAPRVSVRRQRH